ncbi:MAG: carboxypeptidase-like regulatory domain-containing protein, partial [Acidimicrobiia bacterium]
GGPAEGACATAVIITPSGPDGLNRTTVGPDGTYSITGLPAVPMTMYFEQCDGAGPWVSQWWSGKPSPETADMFTPTPGATTGGIDAHFEAAAEIRGHVTDSGGTPIANICAQATGADWFGGLSRTDASGDYRIAVNRPGSYIVQFVDCNETPKYAGQWWDAATSAAAAKVITVTSGDVVDHVDAVLTTGAPATISGKVLDLAGRTLANACVVAYLPDQFAKFSPVAADGTYEITGLPSGTFSLAALGCDEGSEPLPFVESKVPGITYHALWWDDVPLSFEAAGNGPDPIAQGATLVPLAPGAELTDHDWCFGCTAAEIIAATPDTGAITVVYDTPGLAEGVSERSAGADAVGAAAAGAVAADAVGADVVAAAAVLPSPLVASVSCTSDTGVSGSAVGTSTSITVPGLTAGATYTCAVEITATGLLVAASAASAAVTLPGGAVDPTALPTALAFTGANRPLALGVIGFVLLLVGLVAVTAARRGTVRKV